MPVTARAIWLLPDLIALPADLPAPASLEAPEASYPLTPLGDLPAEVAARHPHLAAYRAYAVSAPAAELVRTGPLRVGDEALQIGPLLDALYPAAPTHSYGPVREAGGMRVRLWAPTARAVSLLTLPESELGSAKPRVQEMRREADGSYLSQPLLTGDAYRFRIVRQSHVSGEVETVEVSDPYSVGLSADSRWSVALDLADPDLAPAGWHSHPAPKLRDTSAMTAYELHIRDFSRDDESVPAALRGSYLAFTETGSNGMRHLRELAEAGMNTVHLLPGYDIASIPPAPLHVSQKALAAHAPDSRAQQDAIARVRDSDAFNWGYDPRHWAVPCGAYCAGDEPPAAARRVRETREMVAALHGAGLRVVCDVVFNHTFAAGNHPDAVLDRVLPGYYHRLDADGNIEQSTCMNNTATERAMAAHLVRYACRLWADAYRVDGFRFDLMGHMPAALLEQIVADLGPEKTVYGEGWNFGEVADGRQFVQASQFGLAGSGIATFSDRLRDGVRGGGPSDADPTIQGYGSGAFSHPARGTGEKDAALLRAWIAAGLAGNLAEVRVPYGGKDVPAREIDYNGQPCGYARHICDTVNYVDAHDNETLWDALTLKLPAGAEMADRIRLNTLCLALATWGQAASLWHAGAELLRSKSLDRNSYDSGDWFNRYDVTGADNGFGHGLPPAWDNEERWHYMAPLLAREELRPTPEQVRHARDCALDVLRTLREVPQLRLGSAEKVLARVSFLQTPPELLVMRIAADSACGEADAYLTCNVSGREMPLQLPASAMLCSSLRGGADPRYRELRPAQPVSGVREWRLPPLSALVFVG
ncbi:alpha-1,6-glucosidase domain-containing protein [Dermabacteraceae bacterium P13147]